MMKTLFLFLLLLLSSVLCANPSKTDDVSRSQHHDMLMPRAAHQATLLGDGRVLFTGGCSAPGCRGVQASTEIAQPDQGIFISHADMSVPRASHVAVRLEDGRVLIAGGWTGTEATASAEIFDPSDGAFVPAGSMQHARTGATASKLAGGAILIIGGEIETGAPLATTEIFNPVTAAFSPGPVMQTARAGHVAVSLHDGRVLVAGGHRARGKILASAEIFDPVSGKFHPAGDMHVQRHKHGAALLPDGRVLIVGGANANDGKGRYASSEIFEPRPATFTPGPDMHHARYKLRDAVVALPSGRILVAGGADIPEIFDPQAGKFIELRESVDEARMFATATLLDDNKVLVAGGYTGNIRPSAASRKLEDPAASVAH